MELKRLEDEILTSDHLPLRFLLIAPMLVTIHPRKNPQRSKIRYNSALVMDKDHMRNCTFLADSQYTEEFLLAIRLAVIRQLCRYSSFLSNNSPIISGIISFDLVPLAGENPGPH